MADKKILFYVNLKHQWNEEKLQLKNFSVGGDKKITEASLLNCSVDAWEFLLWRSKVWISLAPNKNLNFGSNLGSASAKRTQNATCDHLTNSYNPVIGGHYLHVRGLKHEEQYSKYCILTNWILGWMCQALSGCEEQDGGVPPEDLKLLQLCVLQCQHIT